MKWLVIIGVSLLIAGMCLVVLLTLLAAGAI